MTTLAREEQADEMLLMGLRLSEGIDLGRLAELGGARPSRPVITELEDLGLLQSAVGRTPGNSGNWRRNELDDIVACAGPGLRPETGTPGPDRIRVTPQGRLVLNAVVAKLSKSFQSP
jgi:oxygen-independent coproporphyrinogen-3 oxidase